VAKSSILEFANQVKTETRKVVWPSRKETVTTAITVLIMASILGIFFFGVDTAFNAAVRGLLGLLS
jgi:preprotein translocase subunit SecE